ncbi:Uncharacterized ABC transporter ATP-binding protein YheS [Comamonas testosteroni]|uniref:Uncharacterized ABC transporter ATP-binding protein YheS n=2 Tax=Comamonas testosteroni TaxID=285 RepID=A0A8B4S3W7_COMTE|nr:Uncharacterized ABC transporter ATP-binding protein YheS [Comamonas testosteroni]
MCSLGMLGINPSHGLMTETRLTLHGVSYTLPNGRPLFSNLCCNFGSQRTAMVGRNGVGKTVLARILAGELPPGSGGVTRAGRIHYLPQNPLASRPDLSIAALAGLSNTLLALERIEQGSCEASDYELLAERWDIRQQFQMQLERIGLPQLAPQTPASQLSGGQAMRVALLGAQLAQADFLILDEPSNHLDAASRSALAQQLQQWRSGLLLISHDRVLLEVMDSVAELTPSAITIYGGNYSFYREVQRQKTQNAQDELARLKLERSRTEQALHTQQQRQSRRQARGEKLGKNGNQAKILLDAGKERAQSSGGKLATQQAAARETLNQNVREAALALQRQVDWQADSIHWHPPQELRSQGDHIVAELRDVQLPHVGPPPPLNLVLRAGQRMAVSGPNGCGKSMLLQLLAGQLQPLTGEYSLNTPFALLDQHQSLLQSESPVLSQLLAASPRTPESLQRMRLAQVGLDARHIDQPSGQLSGGERLKAAMACALYRDEPAQLLLLDEPDNHLDLPSLQALENMLCQYAGTLIIVSHDSMLLRALKLTHQLSFAAETWTLTTL